MTGLIFATFLAPAHRLPAPTAHGSIRGRASCNDLSALARPRAARSLAGFTVPPPPPSLSQVHSFLNPHQQHQHALFPGGDRTSGDTTSVLSRPLSTAPLASGPGHGTGHWSTAAQRSPSTSPATTLDGTQPRPAAAAAAAVARWDAPAPDASLAQSPGQGFRGRSLDLPRPSGRSLLSSIFGGGGGGGLNPFSTGARPHSRSQGQVCVPAAGGVALPSSPLTAGRGNAGGDGGRDDMLLSLQQPLQPGGVWPPGDGGALPPSSTGLWTASSGGGGGGGGGANASGAGAVGTLSSSHGSRRSGHFDGGAAGLGGGSAGRMAPPSGFASIASTMMGMATGAGRGSNAGPESQTGASQVLHNSGAVGGWEAETAAAMGPAFSSSWAVPPGSHYPSQQRAATQGQLGLSTRSDWRSDVGYVHGLDASVYGTGPHSPHQHQGQGQGQAGGQRFGRLSVPCAAESLPGRSKGGVGGGRASTDMSWEETLLMLRDRVTPRTPARQQQQGLHLTGAGPEGGGEAAGGVGGVGAVSQSTAGRAGRSLAQSFRRVIRNISRGARWGLLPYGTVLLGRVNVAVCRWEPLSVRLLTPYLSTTAPVWSPPEPPTPCPDTQPLYPAPLAPQRA